MTMPREGVGEPGDGLDRRGPLAHPLRLSETRNRMQVTHRFAPWLGRFLRRRGSRRVTRHFSAGPYPHFGVPGGGFCPGGAIDSSQGLVVPGWDLNRIASRRDAGKRPGDIPETAPNPRASTLSYRPDGTDYLLKCRQGLQVPGYFPAAPPGQKPPPGTRHPKMWVKLSTLVPGYYQLSPRDKDRLNELANRCNH
jgi:hypothetical protein